MKKLMMLVLICASIFSYSQSYASGSAHPPRAKSTKSAKAHTAAKTNTKVHGGRRKRLQGHNYYRYANTHSYLRYMGKAINGR